MSKKPIIIDTDPGIDDAVAIAIALFSEELDVKLLTTVSGNVSLDKVTNNLLKLLTFWNKRVPVAKGAKKPLLRQNEDASGVHGESGMDGYDFEAPDTSVLLEEHAVEAMRRTILASSEKITLVPIGPLTNIALLLSTYPEVKPHIEEIVLMGGSSIRGNYGVYSEFNIGFDPEAAKIVFESGVKIVMVGLDVGWKALVFHEDSLKIKAQNKTGEMIYALFQKYRGGSLKTGLKMYDACAMAYLLKKEMYETAYTHVSIETQGEYTAGATLVDLKGYLKKEPNATVCLDINASMFSEWLLNALSKCN
ncbi:ribonucleoside hydrolase RihC [Acholeplasma laidlawii]|uniref:ribonucleoside hydrolase RihC n=1 Tax=Acholeplasma laidlawii TaxID=2148 RepID=UPI00084C3730|nr:ribonucleoside hydrolase RihC [Acholeplasma laidlawii]OED58924.1 ribonucleoside hydrolase RihC [Acholeplasma laidlawii]